MRKIDKNLLTIPDFKGEESEIKEFLEGKSKYGKVEAVVLLDPGAFHQVKSVYLRRGQIIMVKLHCPCCGELIEVNPDQGGIVLSSCLKDEKPPTAPKEGPFFDKTLHPPRLAQTATQEELELFKKGLGELPIGSAATEESKVLSEIITKYPSKLISEGSELPVEEEATYERDAQGKAQVDIKKIISDYPLEEDEDENQE